MKARNIGIDIIKFFAALLITNSHMEILYHPYEVLATGGAIGDVLFFFASGFTLFLGRLGRFDNWYKRRINRIYPTVFAWAIMATLIFNKQNNIIDILINGGGWFVTCIMIYYVIMYLVKRFMQKKIKLVFIFAGAVTIIVYFLIERPHGYNMYGNTYYKWVHYFLFMLLGATLGSTNSILNCEIKTDTLKLIISLVTFYGIQILGRNNETAEQFQIVTLIPLLGITYYFYKCSNSFFFKKIYENKFTGTVIKIIGGLCLEIYLVQYALFTDKMNSIFPINIIVMFVIISIAAYVLRCLSRIFSQTFKEQDYDWKAVFSLY